LKKIVDLNIRLIKTVTWYILHSGVEVNDNAASSM